MTETIWVQVEDRPRYHCHHLAGVFVPGDDLPRGGAPLRFELPDGRVLLARTRSATVWRGQGALCVDGDVTQEVGAGARVRVDTAAPPPAPSAAP